MCLTKVWISTQSVQCAKLPLATLWLVTIGQRIWQATTFSYPNGREAVNRNVIATGNRLSVSLPPPSPPLSCSLTYIQGAWLVAGARGVVLFPGGWPFRAELRGPACTARRYIKEGSHKSICTLLFSSCVFGLPAQSRSPWLPSVSSGPRRGWAWCFGCLFRRRNHLAPQGPQRVLEDRRKLTSFL